MAHEVTKRVGNRSYRYRVESYRDPTSGKVRGRWTYLGRVGEDGSANAGRRRSLDTRGRLIAALEELLEHRAFRDITAGQIAEEAALAHGTFYRYFRDKHEALRAAVEQVRDAVDRSVLLAGRAIGSSAAERQRVRAWAEALVRTPLDRPGLVRAWLGALEDDAVLAERRRAARARTADELARYLERLSASKRAHVPHPRGTATALLALLDSTVRGAALGQTFDDEEVAGTLSVIERAIFGA